MNYPSTNAADAVILSNAEMTAEFFQPLISQTFLLDGGGEKPEPVELVSVTPSTRPVPEGFRVPFSLIFRAGSRTFYVPQGICTLIHEQAGRLEIFLVPIGPDAVGMQFESIFN